MAKEKFKGHLFDPRQGGEVLRIGPLQVGPRSFDPARTNYFSIYLVESGAGLFWADTTRFAFGPDSLLFFLPYQYIRLVPDSPVRGRVVQFHANFLCVETFHAEVGCSGILFNDPLGVPIVGLDESTKLEMLPLFERLQREHVDRSLAFSEMMLADLKVLLILATRLKSSSTDRQATADGVDPRHPVVIEFRELIEQYYRTLHSPAEYAELLHVTPKTLGRMVRQHLGTTPTELIRSRILTHAKWHLLHTLRSVKEVARDVGFRDELYFSRLFKKATGSSPTFFREFETEIRGGSNLSMTSSDSPMPTNTAPHETDPQAAKNAD